MTNSSENIRKSTAIYRSPDDINNLKIRVKIKEVPDELAHNEAKEIEDIDGETKVIAWQQKIYGKFEREFYKDKKNCVTDLEKRYHQDVVSLIQNDDVLFTYVNEDEFSLVSEGCVSNSKIITQVHKQVNKVLFMEDEQEFLFKNSTDIFDFKESLIHSLKNPFGSYNFETMYIMADLGEYVGDTWLKVEYILCTIKYDRTQKLFIVFPDFTSFEPYYIQIEGDIRRIFQYYVENASETIPTDVLLKENEILNKIASYQAKLKLQKTGINFNLPPKNKLNVHLFVELLTARKFEYNDIYVQYFIDLPKNWFCKDPSTLKGTTQTSHSSSDDNLSYFGFPFEICLEYSIQDPAETQFTKTPCIYFEVISKDSWDRFRTEGLTYTILPVARPGCYRYNLHCLRICPKGPYSNLRRFFIGDCSSYNDITWTSIPKEFDSKVINKYGTDTVGTGEISIRIDVVHQFQDFMADTKDEASRKHEKFIMENLNKSSLIKSIEQVVEAFKIAKKKMIEVRKNV